MKRQKKLLFLLALTFTLFFSIAVNVSAATIAQIGNKKYTTMQSALDAVKEGQTIVVKANVDYSRKKVLYVNRNVKFHLNLNGKTLKNIKGIVINKGSVTIKNGTLTLVTRTLSGGYKDGGTIKVAKGAKVNTVNLSYYGKFSVKRGGKLTITSGTYKHTLIYNDGETNIKGGTFKNFEYLENEGTARILAGKFTGCHAWDSGMFWYNGMERSTAKLIISGGSFPSSVGEMSTGDGDVYLCNRLFNKWYWLINTWGWGSVYLY